MSWLQSGILRNLNSFRRLNDVGVIGLFHKIIAVEPLPERRLLVKFVDGERKNYDVKPLFERWNMFCPLKDDTLFQSVKVDSGGYGVSWNDEIDISCDEIYNNGGALL